MRDHQKTKRILIAVIIGCLFAAFWQLSCRIRVESAQKTVAPVISYDDLEALSDASGEEPTVWLSALKEAGLTAVILSENRMQDGDAVRTVQDSGLEIAQMGGAPSTGLYFLQADYDLTEEPSASVQDAFPDGSFDGVLVLVENNRQTGFVLPPDFSVTEDTAPWAKCFYPYQNQYALRAASELSDENEIENMLFRAVIDRGITVLWITPFGEGPNLESDLGIYTSLLERLGSRIVRAGYSFGMPAGMHPVRLSAPVLFLCGIGILAGALLLLCMVFDLDGRVWAGLGALGIAESAVGTVLKPELQAMLLAFLASVVFPAIAIVIMNKKLYRSQDRSYGRLRLYAGSLFPGLAFVLIGCCYIGAVLGEWSYMLVLRVFRGVKLSQASVYLFSVVFSAVIWSGFLNRDGKLRLPKPDKSLIVRLLSIVIIMLGVGSIYILRSGDGMMAVSNLERTVRDVLENALVFRPRTKEFLIAWPSAALAVYFAGRHRRLEAWCFSALGGIGFASVANTFCHIRAHVLGSLVRTGLGVLLGMLIGAIILLILSALNDQANRQGEVS